MLAIIGGSGLYSLGGDFEPKRQAPENTPFGNTSGDILLGAWQGTEIAFLARHGPNHRIPPHRINYRANLWALHRQGVRQIIAVNAVGGITPEMSPQTLVLPDQIIDYSHGREHSFFDGTDDEVRHIDFSWPYSAELRGLLLETAIQLGQPLAAAATYACTNGPRLETAAEIARLRRDGCDIVGMTGMPEAGLARELDIGYACLALVVNWAAGIEDRPIGMDEIRQSLEQGMAQIESLLMAASGSMAR